MGYKWTCPHDWLADTARGWSPEVLYANLCALAAKCDSDTLQDEFQTMMDEDGYFNEG